MKIIAFSEGANPRKGGLGLVGVPMLLASTAARGHDVCLLLVGAINPGRENFRVTDPESARERKEGSGTFGIVVFKPWNVLPLAAWSTWAFSPAIIIHAYRCVHGADFVSLHSLYSFPVLVGYLFARLLGKPYGVWPHGALAPFQRTVSPGIKWIWGTLFGNRMLNNASVLFYSSKGEREETAELGLRPLSVIVPHGIHVSEYSVLPSKGSFRARIFPGQAVDLVVFLARVNAKKGLDILVQAMARVVAQRPRARLAIVGPPDPPSFESNVRNWIEESGIGASAVMTGPVPHEEKLEILADADVFVLPSQAENFGFSIFEAMASRVPVVVSDTLNYAAEIADCGAGFSVARDPEDFSEAILRLLADADLRLSMGDKGLSMARRYDWDDNGSAVERVCEALLADRGIPADLIA